MRTDVNWIYEKFVRLDNAHSYSWVLMKNYRFLLSSWRQSVFVNNQWYFVQLATLRIWLNSSEASTVPTKWVCAYTSMKRCYDQCSQFYFVIRSIKINRSNPIACSFQPRPVLSTNLCISTLMIASWIYEPTIALPLISFITIRLIHFSTYSILAITWTIESSQSYGIRVRNFRCLFANILHVTPSIF